MRLKRVKNASARAMSEIGRSSTADVIIGRDLELSPDFVQAPYRVYNNTTST